MVFWGVDEGSGQSLRLERSLLSTIVVFVADMELGHIV